MGDGGLGILIAENIFKNMQNDAFYSISGAIWTQNLVKFYLVVIALFLSNHVVWVYEE